MIACCQAGQLATPLAPVAYNAPLAVNPYAYNAPLAVNPYAYNAAYAANPLAYSNGLAYTSQFINQPAFSPLAKSVAYSSPLIANVPLTAAAYSLPAVSAPIVSFTIGFVAHFKHLQLTSK